MNKIKYITLFIVLALLGAMSSYADIKFNNSYDRFLQAFESSEAKFKFYSMKANVPIEYDIDSDEIKSICIELMSNLGMEESDIKIEINGTKMKNKYTFRLRMRILVYQ